jgi:small subunit ribosomal protein S18
MRRRDSRTPRSCALCGENVKRIDYKDIERLENYLDEGGRIRSRRRTHTCARHQRMVTRAIKRARHVALLPFTGHHARVYG